MIESQPLQTAHYLKSLMVLVADDDRINQRIATLLMKKAGHLSICALNGQEALDCWRKGGIDLILMDIQMPVMNGIDALHAIRREESVTGSYTPCIALTADALKDTEEKLRNEGFDGYLSKPFRMHQFNAVLQKIFKVNRIGVDADGRQRSPASTYCHDLTRPMLTTTLGYAPCL